MATTAADILRDLLRQYGLDSLTTWAMDALARGLSGTQVEQEMRQQPAFIARFPAISERERLGLPAISPAEILANERQYAQIMRNNGMPPSFYDQPEDFTRLLVADKSPAEVQTLVEDGFTRVRQAPPEVRTAFRDYFGVDGDSALAAFFLDPERARPALMKMATQAEIGGAGRQFGFAVSADTAGRIAETTGGQGAAQTFGQLAETKPLFDATVTEAPSLTAAKEGVAAAFGLDAQSRDAVRKRQEERQAQFSGFGGRSGIGSAKDYVNP